MREIEVEDEKDEGRGGREIEGEKERRSEESSAER